MPEDEYVWLPRTAILSFEEIERLVALFAGLGVHKVRLTGGEPLLRHDLSTLIGMIARNGRVDDLAMTTNGLLLAKHAAALRAAGLERVTVSLDTLHPERMLSFAKSTLHADVLEGITAARQAGFAKLKPNAVVIRGSHGAVVADQRPRPDHRHRHLVPVAQRRAGHRAARGAAPRCHRSGAHGAHPGDVAGPHRSRRGGATRDGGPGRAVSDRFAARRSPPRDAHPGRVTSPPFPHDEQDHRRRRRQRGRHRRATPRREGA